MTQRIIYKPLDGGVAVIVPASETLEQYSIEAIALKDVPAGLPFKIVDIVDIPSDRTFRSAWEIDASTLTDGIGSDSNEFPEVTE